MFEQALAHHDSGVRLLASRQTWTDHAATQPESYQEIIKLALSTHSLVIVSSEDAHHLSQLTSLSNSDHIVLAMRLDLLSLHRAQHHITVLRTNQVSLERLEVVAMETGRPGQLPVAAVAKSLGVPRIHLIPEDAMANTVSINLGHPLVLESPNSPASIAIRKLASMLMGADRKDVTATRSGHLANARAAALGAMNALVGRL
jgi:MinD-like ATPase involved in chromosome partitioning or flagellar assembly